MIKEVKEQHKDKISYSFVPWEVLVSVDIRQNIRTSSRDSLWYWEVRKNVPWFDKFYPSVERTGIMAESWNSGARNGGRSWETAGKCTGHCYAIAGRQQLRCSAFYAAPWFLQVAPRFTGNCAGLVKIVKDSTKIMWHCMQHYEIQDVELSSKQ
jgi:hypothetical protein